MTLRSLFEDLQKDFPPTIEGNIKIIYNWTNFFDGSHMFKLIFNHRVIEVEEFPGTGSLNIFWMNTKDEDITWHEELTNICMECNIQEIKKRIYTLIYQSYEK